MDFCAKCGLITILEHKIGPRIRKVEKLGLTKIFPYNTDNPKEADAYLVDEFIYEDPDGELCPKCGAELTYDDDDEYDEVCSICKRPEAGHYFQGGGGVCCDCEETPEGSALLDQLLMKWHHERSANFLARKADEELQKLDPADPHYHVKRTSLLTRLLYYNVKSINKKYGL
jgi:hypothetical protein